MSVNSIENYQSGINSASGAAPTSAIGSVDQTKQQFLTLLITQLKNQDPLSPADSSQFTSQMMQMGQLEQLFDLNKTMLSNYELQQGGQIAQYSSLVGKNVLATGNQFQITDASKGSINFGVAGTPTATKLNVFDQYENLVRSLDLEQVRNGGNTVNFDGLNSAGQPLPNGYYSFFVEPKDSNNDPISATTYSSGQISGIRIENGSPVFQMGDTDVPVAEIQKIY